MIAHEHVSEVMGETDFRQHILGMHEGLSASGAMETVEASHAEDHRRALREVLALAGHSAKGLHLTGMPLVMPDAPLAEHPPIPQPPLPALPTPAPVDIPQPSLDAVRHLLEQRAAAVAPSISVQDTGVYLTREQYAKLLAVKNLLNEALP